VLLLEKAFGALGISKITNGRPARYNRPPKHMPHGGPQFFFLLPCQGNGRRQWMQAGFKEHLVGIDVADSR
jgi:hypothetical protein